MKVTSHQIEHTPEERRRELCRILAIGVIRVLRVAAERSSEKEPESRPSGLESS